MSLLEDSLFAEFKLFGLPMPERQFVFHPVRKWHLDFAWVDRRIAVEVNGGLYVTGRHNRGAQLEQEFEKLNEACRLGWDVFLFGPKWLYRPKRSVQSSKALAYMHQIFRGGDALRTEMDIPMDQDSTNQNRKERNGRGATHAAKKNTRTVELFA